MNPPVPRAWLGLAFFFGLAMTVLITRTLDSWTALVPVPENVPLGTRRGLLTLEMMVLGSSNPGNLVGCSKHISYSRLAPRNLTVRLGSSERRAV